jgi:hypothetical protein
MSRLRIESEPDQVAALGYEGRHLPRLLASALAPIGLAMTIRPLDSRDKLIQGVFSLPRSQHDAAIFSHIERHLVAFRQPRLFENRSRNSHRQAVSPFRKLRFVRHIGSTLTILHNRKLNPGLVRRTTERRPGHPVRHS